MQVREERRNEDGVSLIFQKKKKTATRIFFLPNKMLSQVRVMSPQNITWDQGPILWSLLLFLQVSFRLDFTSCPCSCPAYRTMGPKFIGKVPLVRSVSDMHVQLGMSGVKLFNQSNAVKSLSLLRSIGSRWPGFECRCRLPSSPSLHLIPKPHLVEILQTYPSVGG